MTGDPAPESGGVFVRLSRIARRWGFAVPVIEELYGPTRHDARQQVQEQAQLAEPAPAPADPPLRDGEPARPASDASDVP